MPTMPVELILLPRWFPIHLSKMSYWARTVIVPLLVLAALRPRARNPRAIHVAELFVPGASGELSLRAPHQSRGWSVFFGALDVALKRFEPFWPKRLRRAPSKNAAAGRSNGSMARTGSARSIPPWPTA